MTIMIANRIDLDRLNAVLRMIAYAIDEAKDLDAHLLKYTLEVALSAGAELLLDAQTEYAKINMTDNDYSVFFPPNS